MTNSRREKIESMLKEEPHDVFLRYSLAMEMSSDGEIEQALTLFSQLAQGDPPHVPAYFRSAQLLADRGDVAAARLHLRDGIEVARAQSDAHAASEMSEMLAELGTAGE